VRRRGAERWRARRSWSSSGAPSLVELPFLAFPRQLATATMLNLAAARNVAAEEVGLAFEAPAQRPAPAAALRSCGGAGWSIAGID
jgi:hypothetical protein